MIPCVQLFIRYGIFAYIERSARRSPWSMQHGLPFAWHAHINLPPLCLQVNVLISTRGKACLTDFGFAKVLEEVPNWLLYVLINMTDCSHMTVRSRIGLYHSSDQCSVERPRAHRSSINRSVAGISLNVNRCLEFRDALP